VFTNGSKSALIQIVKENVDAFRNGRLNFWEQVSNILEGSRHHYTADDCKSEFKNLEKQYKEIEVIRKKNERATP
jgi:hypothetical protein